MSSTETKIEQWQRIIKHKRKKEEWRQAMKTWEALNREPPKFNQTEFDRGYFYAPYIPIMKPSVFSVFTGDTSA